MHKNFRILLSLILPLGLLASSLGIAVALFKGRPEPPKREKPEVAYLVEVAPVTRSTQVLNVHAQGVVEAARQVRLQPQVVGTVTRQHDRLVPGGLINKGEVAIKIDPTDYQLAIDQQLTNVEDAKARLSLERGQQVIAQKEWELFKKSGHAPQDSSLALRKPQLRQAEVAVKAAESRLEQARVNLRRTTLRAPFDALVQSESVEVGQLVTTQTSIATLVGTETFWVRANVPLDYLDRIDIPGLSVPVDQPGSRVTIEQDVADRTVTRQGRVSRLLGELDQVGRLAQVLIAVEDPLGLDASKEDTAATFPLLIGSYVRVVLDGSREIEVIEVPRSAVHNGREVWVMTDEETLDIRTVEIVGRRLDTLLVREGLREGDVIVTSRIGTPIQGMKLRAARDEGAVTDAQSGGAR